MDTPPRGVATCLPRRDGSLVGPFPWKACRAGGRSRSGSIAGVAGLLPLPRGVAEPRPVRGVRGMLPAVGGRGGKPRPGGVDCVLVVLRAVMLPLGDGEVPSGTACFLGSNAVASASVRARIPLG